MPTALSLIFIPLFLAVFSVIFALPGALFLRLSCSLLSEKSPSYGRAVRITATAFWVQIMLNTLVLLMSAWADIHGLFLLTVAFLPATVKVYSVMLPLRFGRAAVVAVLQILVLVVGVAITGGVMHLASWWDPSILHFLTKMP